MSKERREALEALEVLATLDQPPMTIDRLLESLEGPDPVLRSMSLDDIIALLSTREEDR